MEAKEKRKKIFVLLKKDEMIGTFTTLSKLCEDVKLLDAEFPSYWTLSRKTDEMKTEKGYSFDEYTCFATLLINSQSESTNQGNPALRK